MIKKTNDRDNFFNDINYRHIVSNIKNVYMSDGSMSVLLDFERVLDNFDIYAFKNWRYGELVSGPKIKPYSVTCVFMWDYDFMPNPAFIRRVMNKGIEIEFLEKKIKVPVKVENYDDFEPGTHFPKMHYVKKWFVQITIPRELMDEIRSGTIELAGQEIDLDDLDDSYKRDIDKKQNRKMDDNQQQQMPGMSPLGGIPSAPPGLGGMGMPPPGMGGMGGPML